jgi:hypothetical protein
MYVLNWKGYITKVENLVTDQLMMINETIMAYFMLLSQHLPSGTEQSHKYLSGQPTSGTEIEPEIKNMKHECQPKQSLF